ncbi:MAG: hypothetical protein ACM3MG_04030 [Bacillota bacterium]
MTKVNTVVIGGITMLTQLAHASETANIALKNFNQIGLDPEVIQEIYRKQADVELDWNEVLKVSADEEGKNININTLDGISVVVPIYSAAGPFNKGDTHRD